MDYGKDWQKAIQEEFVPKEKEKNDLHSYSPREEDEEYCLPSIDNDEYDSPLDFHGECADSDIWGEFHPDSPRDEDFCVWFRNGENMMVLWKLCPNTNRSGNTSGNFAHQGDRRNA